jgi:hypothetical protein
LFNFESNERVAIAAVLAALSAVPISLGLATRQPAMHLVWLGLGIGMWLLAIIVLCTRR